ncbi:MAG TPA: secondary thiamine-phosphate synthase enzyme YjbQ [Geminicoccaceae bacterium]|jgi:secondary thiamine-phosphate synthase enzyme|nr:secondary thiamine-phosphate synthase enzyme YjbQ [Geminicoccaceae bacterium]
MRQQLDDLSVTTEGQRLYEITDRVRSWVAAQGIERGLLTVYLHHTSASLVIQENADPRVLDDLNAFFRKLVVEDVRHYSHSQEGPDDMPAHIRAALTATHLSIPVVAGKPDLGRWQGIFLFEHRARGRERKITLHLLGE